MVLQPIGGQSAIVKWKWGKMQMKCFINQPKFIKFALGENKTNHQGNI
jgi:hypothetical protein